MFSAAARDQLMTAGGTGAAWLSLHSAFPGTNGANEIALTRASIPWTATSGGHKRAATQISITVPGNGQNVHWLGAWSLQSGGTFGARAPIGGHPLEFYVTLSDNRVRIPGGNKLSDGTRIVFFGDTPPAPLVEATHYFVRDSLADSFRASGVPGGTAITLTTAGGNQCLVSDINPFTINSASALIIIPKLFLRFIRNFDPVWTASPSIQLNPGESFDLRTIVGDANGDALIFSI